MGQAKAWPTDLEKAKGLLGQRLGEDSLGQGFRSDATGKLLCPITHDWCNKVYVVNKVHPRSFLTPRRDQESLRGSPQTITANSWPMVFYQNLEFEPQRPWEGFLRSNTLVMVRTIAFEWESCCPHVSKMYRCVFKDSGGPPLEPYQGLSFNSIAYIATMVLLATNWRASST
jgi:hypothetical protein